MAEGIPASGLLEEISTGGIPKGSSTWGAHKRVLTGWIQAEGIARSSKNLSDGIYKFTQKTLIISKKSLLKKCLKNIPAQEAFLRIEIPIKFCGRRQI